MGVAEIPTLLLFRILIRIGIPPESIQSVHHSFERYQKTTPTDFSEDWLAWHRDLAVTTSETSARRLLEHFNTLLSLFQDYHLLRPLVPFTLVSQPPLPVTPTSEYALPLDPPASTETLSAIGPLTPTSDRAAICATLLSKPTPRVPAAQHPPRHSSPKRPRSGQPGMLSLDGAHAQAEAALEAFAQVNLGALLVYLEQQLVHYTQLASDAGLVLNSSQQHTQGSDTGTPPPARSLRHFLLPDPTPVSNSYEALIDEDIEPVNDELADSMDVANSPR